MASKSQDQKAQSKKDQDKVGGTGEAARQSLPFEPKQKAKQKSAEQKPQPVRKGGDRNNPRGLTGASESGIPQVVSRRMSRRMAIFCGVPTALGMLTFVVSYFLVSHDWLKLPTYAVLLVSLGWFGLGVVGLTYGVLSASWEEDQVGSRLGFGEFKTNLGRTIEGWRENSEKVKAARAEAAQSKAQSKSPPSSKADRTQSDRDS